MDPNRLLLWIVCISSGLNCIQAIWIAGVQSSTALIPGFILGTTLLSAVIWPNSGGWIGGLLWAGLLVLPGLGFRQISGLIAAGRYGQAYGLARTLSGFYRLYGLRDLPWMLRALTEAKQGDLRSAHQVLDQLSPTPSSLLIPVLLELFRTTARWEEALDWMETAEIQAQLSRDPGLSLAYLRALGESGELLRLLRAYRQVEPILQEVSNPLFVSLAQLILLGFCGQVQQVTALFQGPLSQVSKPVQRFWVATARQAHGEQPIQEWQQLAQMEEVVLANGARRRLSHGLADPRQQLRPEHWQQLTDFDPQHQKRTSAFDRAMTTPATPYGTYGLIGLNLGVFALEVALGGSTNLETLYFLGGLVPELVGSGEWWRTLTATLLHFGPLHLIMNMLGLWVLGPFVEQMLGLLRYLGVYWGAGVGSMGVIALLSLQGVIPTEFVVGASGSIMGMVGASAAILWRIWHQHRSQRALRQLRVILLIIVLQLIFDLTTPQISVVGHTSGLILGFVIGGVLVLSQRESESE